MDAGRIAVADLGLAAGVDLRTVAGRLGHGDGTTTLRTYAACVAAADRRASEQMARSWSSFASGMVVRTSLT